MAFTLPWTVNKIVSTNINDANSVTGTYGAVSLKVNGKTELTGDTVLINKVGIGKNVTSYPLDIQGNVNASGIHINNTPITDSLTTRNIAITPVPAPVTIANWNFATPARPTTNSFQVISAPYTTVTGWTLSAVVGTPFQVCIMRGFAQFINTYETLYPDYPSVTQAIGISQNTVPNTFRIEQNIAFTQSGNYQLTFWIWGMYNTYRITQTITASINGYSQVFIGVEQLWTKCLLRFVIPSAGSYNLVFDFINTFSNSVLCMTSVKIERQTGLVISDGGVVNNQFINSSGLFTTAIENRGPLVNYGGFKNYGTLGLYVPYSNGSIVIGTSSYGSSSLDGGSNSVFIGSSIAVASPNASVIANQCIAIGYGALEQLTAANRLHAIGHRCLRYCANVNDNVGYGYSAGENLGYPGSTSSRNVVIGNYALNKPATTNDCVSIGHNNMASVNFTTGASFCVSIGSGSMVNVASNYNTQIGASAVTAMVNTGSTYNTFVGAQVCNTQSGASNVLTNCTFLGSTSDVSVAGNYSNSTAIGYGALITASNRIILGRATETTFAMGGLTIPASTILTLLGNISANSLTITPVELSYLSGITGIVATSGNQTISGIKTFSSPPVMSGASISSATIPNSALVNGANYITTNLTQTISAVNTAGSTVTITPAQFAFLNSVLLPPSANAGKIPQSSISNVTDFLKATVAATVSAAWSFTNTLTFSGASTVNSVFTFNTNPVFNPNAIEASCIDNTTIPRFIENGQTITVPQDINAVYTFNTNPSFNTDAIDSYWIDNTTFPRFIEIGATITTDQTINAVYTFSVNPVFNNDAIPAIKIDNTTTPRFVDLSSTQTITALKTYTGGLTTNTLTTDSIILSNKSQLESVVVIASSLIGYNWSFGSPNTIVISGSSTQTVRFPVPTTQGLGTIVHIVIQDASVLTVRCLNGSGYNVVDSENNQVLTITYPSTVKYVSFMCVSTGTGAWKYVGGQLPNASIVPLNSGNNTFSGAINTFQGDVTLGSSSSNFINLIGNLYDVGTATAITPVEVTCLSGCSSNIQTTLNTLNTKTTAITYNSGTTTTSFANNVSMSNINPSGATDLNIGNSSQTTKIKGVLTIEDGAQRINGYGTLSGSPNVLSKPLNEYYTLSTSSNGSIQLPIIDSSMFGSQITFTKSSTAAIWTINRGGTDTFRLYKSNSTATATSITLDYNETVVRIVATQGGIWDVIQTDIFYNAASDWVCGTQYFPMLMSPTNITAATNWNASLPSAFYGIHGFSITTTVSITLPLSTNINVPDGMRIKFRRIGGTLATALNATASTGDTIMANNALATTAAGTAVVLVTSSAYWGEIYLNKTTKVWYCM